MAIVKMKRLRLAAVKSQREQLLKQLMLLGCVEISRPEGMEAEEELAALLSREPAGYFERRREYESLIWAISLLDKYSPKKSPLLSARPQVERSVILDESAVEQALSLAAHLDQTDDRIRNIDAELSHISATLESLEPWKAMDIPLDMTETAFCLVQTGTVPAFVELRSMEDALMNAGCDSALYEISADSDARYLLLITMKAQEKEAAEALRTFGWSRPSVGEFRGTAAENIDSLKKRAAELEEKKARLSEEIRAAAPSRDDLKLCSDRMLTVTEEAEHAERLLYTDSAFIFEGWLPAQREKDLEEVLAGFDCAWDTRDPTEEEIPQVPIQLKSNKLTKPMNMVTEMYSLPAYNGVDPNTLILPSFAVFFGIMFADLGYGLILLLAGLVIKFKVRPRATIGYMGGLAIICGISCMIFGAATGTFFGDIIPQAAMFFTGKEVTMPMLMDPLADPMTILIICLALGIVHMLLGTAVNGYMLIRDGQWVDALCDVGSTWLVFAGVALGALGVTWYVLYAGVAAIILTQGRSSPSIFGKLGGGLWGLYNFVTGWFGDILSYCRLMALMLASAVIAQVFNTLGAMTGSVVFFIIIFLIGHALNFGLNIIGTFVHTSRLEYLEFFGKFYRDGGRAFQPFEMKTNYYDVIN